METISQKQSEVRPHVFTFSYPATETRDAGERKIEVSQTRMPKVRELAKVFGLEPGAFLEKMVTGALPGQLPRYPKKGDRMMTHLKEEHVNFACFNGELRLRIERAAQACEQTVDEYVATAVASNVDGDEQNIILHPTTGEMLCGNDDALITDSGFYYQRSAAQQTPAVELEPFTIKLSPEAVKAVLAYEKATGFGLDDIASGILVGALTPVLELTENRDDENWRIHAGDVQTAATLRKKGALGDGKGED